MSTAMLMIGKTRCSYLGSRYAQEAYRHEHTCHRHLVVTELDAVEVLHAETVRGDQTVQSEDLVHLNSRHQGASTLTNDMRDCTMPTLSTSSSDTKRKD